MRDPDNEVEESHVSQTNRVFLKRGLQPHRGSCFMLITPTLYNLLVNIVYNTEHARDFEKCV